MKAAEGALIDLGKKESSTYGVIDHHFIAWTMIFAKKYLSGVLNYMFMKTGLKAN